MLVYEGSSGLLALTLGRVTQHYTLWNLARLGIVDNETIARAILSRNEPQTVPVHACDLLTPGEVARHTSLNAAEITRLAKAGAIPCHEFRCGNDRRRIHRRFDPKEVVAALDQAKTA